MGEIIFHILIMGGLGVFYNEALHINTSRMTDVIGAAGFPKAIIILGFVLTAISLYISYKKYVEAKRNASGAGHEKAKELNIQFAGILGTVIVFIFMSHFIGYFLGAILLMIAIMFLLGQKKVSKIVSISVVTSLVFTVVFGKVLHVPLPRGIGVIKELSFLLF